MKTAQVHIGLGCVRAISAFPRAGQGIVMAAAGTVMSDRTSFVALELVVHPLEGKAFLRL